MNKDKRNFGKKLFSMKYKIMLICLCSILFTMFSISSSTLPRITRELRTATENHLNNFVVDHSEKITSNVLDIYDTMNKTMNTTDRMFSAYTAAMGDKDKEAKNIFEAHKQGLNEDLKQITEKTKYNDTVHVIISSGIIVCSSAKELSDTKMPEESMKGFSQEKDVVSVESSYDEATKAVTLTYAKPVFGGDNLVGYVVYVQDSLAINEILNDYSLIGIAAPRISILDENGMAVAHTDNERIGTLTTNKVSLEELETIRSGSYKKEGPQSVIFKSDGKDFTLSYIYLPEMNWLLTMSVSNDMLYSGVNAIVQYYVIILVIVLCVVMTAVFFVVNMFTKPIIRMGNIISKIGELDFTIDVEDKQFKNICKRRDEIGDMGTSVEEMVYVVKERLETVLQSSKEVNEAAAKLKDITTNISEKATDTSATTEELSAGMEETSASTDVILSDVDSIQNSVAAIKEEVSTNTNATLEIMARADRLKEESIQSEQNTRTTFEGIKKKGADAIEQSKATAQINELAQVIMDIADQTSLLALNAAIEAARAGESGKGFAVVADEIGNLAQQSSDTVNKISGIVQNVNEAVENMRDCLTASQEFVINNVYKDYAIQLQTLESYNKDAENIHSAMNQIDVNTQSLYVTMQSMTDSLRGITHTMQEAAVGVADIAQKNSEIGDLTSESYQMVNDTNRIAGELEESISVFKL